MSFDLFVWDSRTRVSPAEAEERYAAADEGDAEHTDESAALQSFLDELYGRFPDLEDCDEAEVEESPWSSDLDRGDEHACFNIRWSHAEEMASIVIDLALHHGLSCFDPQTSVVHQPTGLPEKH